MITKQEYQMILGTIMGGSSIVLPKNGNHCYLSMRDNNIQWLNFKASQLSNFSSEKSILKETTNRWHSKSNVIFDKFKKNFYTNNQRLLHIDNLNFWDFGLAIWFGDAGKLQNGNVILNTHIWGDKGSNIIAKYFNLCQWNAHVFKDRKYYRVCLSRESSIHFINLIAPHLPKQFF
jgi:hypothetical protein